MTVVDDPRRLTSKEHRVRPAALFLIALSIPVFAGCGSGVTVEADSPVDIPEKVEVGGATVQTPEVTVGNFKVDPKEDRITGQ